MKNRRILRLRALVLGTVIVGLATTASVRYADLWPVENGALDQPANRFAQWAGRTWHKSEELADDMCSAVSKRFAAARDSILPRMARQPPAMPTDGDQVSMETDQPAPTNAEPTQQGIE